MPLRPDDFYRRQQHRHLRLGPNGRRPSTSQAREVALAGGGKRCLRPAAAGDRRRAGPPAIPGADQPHVHTLRSLADCQAIIAARQIGAPCGGASGASFIGLEVAASLRARELEVHVVAPEKRPMERILGPQMGDFIRALHEEHGVVFHLGETATAIDGKRVKLKSGDTLEADLVVVGIGVRPALELAEKAGLAIDRGVIGERIPRNQRAGRLRRGRHRPLARPA